MVFVSVFVLIYIFVFAFWRAPGRDIYISFVSSPEFIEALMIYIAEMLVWLNVSPYKFCKEIYWGYVIKPTTQWYVVSQYYESFCAFRIKKLLLNTVSVYFHVEKVYGPNKSVLKKLLNNLYSFLTFIILSK